LEGKNIINPVKLQNREEMQSLLKDIMKLDLSKFSKPRKHSTSNPKDVHTSESPRQKRKAHPSPAPPTSDVKSGMMSHQG
jgi:hypothetical protein